MRTIKTEIHIDAPPERVWALLTDFAGHPAWDPFLAAIEGEPRLGARLRVRFKKGGTFRPRVTELADGRVLEWLGSLGVRGIFDGRHRFELAPDGAGTRLRHSERFSGLLVPFVGGILGDAARGFDAFNRALKAQAEQGSAWAKSAG
jgi:hypothetical protein